MPFVLPAIAAAVTSIASGVAAAATTLGAAAAMALGGDLVGAGFALSVAGSTTLAGSFTVASALELGALVGASALLAPHPAVNTKGSPQQFKPDPQAPIPFVEGRYGVGGNLVYETTSGGGNDSAAGAKGNEYLTTFVILSAGPIQKIETLRFNDTILNWDPNGQACTGGYIPKDEVQSYNPGYSENADGSYANNVYQDHAWQNTQLGSLTAGYFAPPSKLASDNAPLTEWTNAHGFSGFAAAALTIVYDQRVYAGGVPQYQWTLQGGLRYDPRQDSTYAGGAAAGAQRWAGAGASTAAITAAWGSWAFNQNPAIAALNYALGYYRTDPTTGLGRLYAGIGAGVAGVDIDAFVRAANVADANGWLICGQWTTGDGKWSVLTEMLKACSATPVIDRGIISCIVDTPLTSLNPNDPITADDLAGSISLPTGSTMSARVNTVFPRYSSEAHRWQVVQADTPVKAATYVTEDGRVRSKTIDWQYVPAVNQACQLAAYTITNSRELSGIVLPGKPKLRNYTVGDCLTIDIPEAGLATTKVMVTKRETDPMTGGVTLTVRTETDAKHAYSLGLTGVAPATPAISGYDPTIVEAPLLSFWTSGALEVTDATTGESRVVISVTGSATSDNVYAKFVDVRYRAVTEDANGNWNASGTAQWTYQQFSALQDGFQLDLNPGSYDVQIAYTTVSGAYPAADEDWLDLGVETVGGSTAANAAALGGTSAATVLSAISIAQSNIAAQADQVAALGTAVDTANQEIAELTATYGDTASAEASAEAAQAAATAAAAAQTNAQTAESQAQDALTDAQTAATDALSSANASAGSATTASTAAGTAATMAGQASDSSAAAQDAATTATTQAQDASDSASAASTSATSAATSATTAGQQASAAQTAATTATTQAGNASTSASSAATSATTATTASNQASTYASQASNSATAAGGSASAAATQASNASTSATQAGASATSATSSANTASAAASTATGAATTAANQASAAQSSAAAASTSAAAAQTSSTVAAQVGTNALNPNSAFAVWSGSLPEHVSDWSNAVANTTQVAGQVSPYALQLVTSASLQTCGFAFYQAQNPTIGPGWYVVEIDIRLTSGALTNAGVLFQGTTSTGAGTPDSIGLALSTTPDITGSVNGAGVAGTSYKWRTLVEFTSATSTNFNLYGMNAWNGFAGAQTAKTIIWDRLDVRPASTAEVAGDQAYTVANATSATLSAFQTAQASQNSAFTASINSNTSTLNSLSSTVNTNAQTQATNAATFASQISTLSSQIVSNPNLIPNGGFAGGLTGWTFNQGAPGYYDNAQWGRLAYCSSISAQGPEFVSPLFGAGVGAQYTVSGNIQISVQAGTAAYSTCIAVNWFDANKNFISSSTTSAFQYGLTTTVSAMPIGTFVSPANAVYAQVYVPAFISDASSDFLVTLYAQRLKLELGASFTGFNDSASTNTLTASVTATSATVATLTGQLYGSYTLNVTAGSVVTGMQLLSASGATTLSAIIFQAENFLIKSASANSAVSPFAYNSSTGTLFLQNVVVSSLSALSANLGTVTAGLIQNAAGTNYYDITNGQIVFNNGTIMKAMGTGFGANSDLMEWTGPSMAISACTKANATISYTGTDGSGFYGGAFAAGQKTESAQNPTVSSSATISSAAFPYTGKGMQVIIGFSYTGVTTIASGSGDGSTTNGTNSVTVTLYRSINGGSQVAVGSYNFSGTWSNEKPTAVDNGIFQSSCGGSTSVTDTSNVSSGDSLVYTATITAWGVSQGGTQTQTLSISVNEP